VPPAGIEPDRSVLAKVAPAVEAYWTDQPAREIAAPVLLASSMKSRSTGAPLLPPPP
jgi:hypothetical protein